MSKRARSRINKRQVAEALFRTGPEDEDGEGDTPDAEPPTLTTVTGEEIDLRKPWLWPKSLPLRVDA